jgi:hypothetical protein
MPLRPVPSVLAERVTARFCGCPDPCAPSWSQPTVPPTWLLEAQRPQDIMVVCDPPASPLLPPCVALGLGGCARQPGCLDGHRVRAARVTHGALVCTISTRCWTMQPSRQMEDSIIAHEDANVASMDAQERTRAFASCVELSQTHTDNGLFARPREHTYQQGHLATHFCLLRMALNVVES